jgi:hypothetical protein
MDGKEFMFVDQNTKSTYQKPHRRLVNQHAQRFAMAGRRLKLAPSSAPRGWLASKPHTHRSSTSEQGSTSTTSPSSASKDMSATNSPTRQQEVDTVGSNDSHHGLVQILPSTSFPIVQVLDPFQTTRIPVRPWTYKIIDYYTRFWVSPPDATGPYLQRRTRIFHDAVSERVRSCLSSELHMNSLAAAVAARMHFVSKNAALGDQDRYSFVTWFLHKAIGALRQYFFNLKDGDDIDSQALVDIMDLYKASYYALRIDAGRPHLRIFNTLVDRVSVNSQDIRCRDAWNLRDVIDAVSAKSPLYLASVFTTNPWENITKLQCGSQKRRRDPFGSTGVGFQAVLSMMGGDLAILVQAVVKWAQEAEPTFGAGHTADEVPGSLYSRASDLLMSLLWLPPPPPTVLIGEQRINITVYDCRVPCVRFALIMWLLYSMNHAATFEASKVILSRVKDTFNNFVVQVVQHDFELPPPQQELFLWIATVYILAEEHTSPEEQFFTTKITQICQTWHMDPGQQLSSIAKRFLYFESVQGKSLRDLGEKLDASHKMSIDVSESTD